MAQRDLRHISFEGAALPRRALSPAPGGPGPGVACRPEPDVRLPRWILATAGLDAGAYRPESLHRRIPACLRALKAHSHGEARQRITDNRHLLAVAVDSLLIGVTDYFRDQDVFESLRGSVFPALAGSRPLRIWSAGCASGPELYAVACLLADAGLLDHAELVGTDCRARAVREARVGWVDAAQAAALPAGVLLRHFEQVAPNRWRPIDRLRRRIEWKVADVLGATEAGPWHVILWRNVAIYLTPESAADVCRRLSAELGAGGYLVLGKAERPLGVADLGPVARCIYRKRGA